MVPPSTVDSPGLDLGRAAVPAPSNEPVLEARSVIRELGPSRERILHGVSFAATKGEFVAITGSSGSGKSTLLYLLGALDRPDGGAVYWKGGDLALLDDDARAAFRNRHLGFVFQFHFLLPEFSVVENVALPMRRRGDDRTSAHEKALRALEFLGLEGLSQRRPAQLSGGQQQRVAIARAVAHEPEVVLADEPTGSLDSANGEAVFEVLSSLAAARGATVIVVTHDAALASRADRRLVMRDGVITHDTRR